MYRCTVENNAPAIWLFLEHFVLIFWRQSLLQYLYLSESAPSITYHFKKNQMFQLSFSNKGLIINATKVCH